MLIYLILSRYISILTITCERQFYRATAMSHNQAQVRLFTLPTEYSTEGSAICCKVCSSNTLDCGSLKSAYVLEPITASTVIASIKKLFKLFMQIDIESVKSQVQVLALLTSAKPKEQPLKTWFSNIYFGKLHLYY